MEPVFASVAAIGRAPTVGESADETKYDSRYLRDRIVSLQRVAILVVVIVFIALLTGDGLIFRKSRRDVAKSTLATGGNFRTRASLRRELAERYQQEHQEEKPEEDTWGQALAQQPGHDDQVGEDRADGAAPGEAGDVWSLDGEEDRSDQPADAEFARRQADGEEVEEVGRFDGNDADLPRWRGDDMLGHDGKAADDAVQGDRKNQAVEEDADRDKVDWRLNQDAASCDGWFGNGFVTESNIVSSDGIVGGDANDGELLRCGRHPSTNAAYCIAKQVIVYPSRVTVSKGGESLQQVMGRSEDMELPQFSEGAIEIYANSQGFKLTSDSPDKGPAASIPQSAFGPVYYGLQSVDGFKARMLSTTEVAGPGTARTCSQIVNEPILFVTRVEYANLFHTSTDWWNVWQAARIAGLVPTTDYAESALSGITPEAQAMEASSPRERTRRIPAHVVFVDGHNAGPMDDGWRALFLSINYIKHLPERSCFAHTIWAPYGYHAAISQGFTEKRHTCAGNAFVQQFGNDFVRSFGLEPRKAPTCMEATTPILFVRRVHYLAHPRHNGQIVRRLDNEDEIVQLLTEEARSPVSGMRLLNGLFSSMTMKEQVQAVQDACVIVGAHGAGLSHVLFAPPGVHMLELQPPAFQRPHFIAYTLWSGSHHHLWSLSSSSPLPRDVVNRIRDAAREAAVEERVA